MSEFTANVVSENSTLDGTKELEVEEDVLELKRQYLISKSTSFEEFTITTYKRFLIGRKRNTKIALRDLLQFAKWREDHHARTLTLNDCGEYGKRRVSFLHGRDKLNRPVVVTLSRRQPGFDRDITEVAKYIIHVFDQALAASIPGDEKILSLLDLSGFSLRNMDFETTRIYFNCLQLYYPESLGQLLILNAPLIFSACWAIIRPWLDADTAAKFKFIHYDELENYIDRDQICPEVGLSAEELADEAED